MITTNKIWTIYSEDLKRFITSKVKNEAIADDILQDTFIKIHTNLHTLKDVDKLKSWCFAIARNLIMDYFKTKNQTFEMQILPAVGKFDSEITIENKEHSEQDCLRGILKSLPKKYRTPLFLSDIKGMKQQSIADQLHQSLSTTKSQIQRARKLIAEGFIDCCGFSFNEKGVLVGEIQDEKDCKVCG